MEIIGIVAEYNPFHNGHIYQIKKIKELYPDSLIIVCLNGNYTMRGDFSYSSKEDKVNTILNYGVDIVLELPYIYGTQSGDIFAYQAVKLLNAGGITTLVFGSESNDIEKLKTICRIQEQDDFDDKLKDLLSTGITYKDAMKQAIDIDFEYLPNDLLGISYIKAINKINKNIKVQTIKRTNDYYDLTSNEEIISADNIRNKFNNNEDIKRFTPVDKLNIINYELYFKLLKTTILNNNNLKDIVDVNEGIEGRLVKYIKESSNIYEFIDKLKTKRYSYNKIKRMLLHILIGFKKIDNKDYDYFKILGFNKKGKEYLNKNNINIVNNYIIREYELRSAIIYDLINNTKVYEFELKNKPIIKS